MNYPIVHQYPGENYSQAFPNLSDAPAPVGSLVRFEGKKHHVVDLADAENGVEDHVYWDHNYLTFRRGYVYLLEQVQEQTSNIRHIRQKMNQWVNSCYVEVLAKPKSSSEIDFDEDEEVKVVSIATA